MGLAREPVARCRTTDEPPGRGDGLQRAAQILTEVVAAAGLGLWLLVAFELLSAYLKSLGLAGAPIGDLGIAIVEVGEVPSSLAMLLTLTAVIWFASERLVRGEPVLHRLLPVAFAGCAAILTATAAAVHVAFAARADAGQLDLFGGLTWPLLVFSLVAVSVAGAIAALLARATDGRPWAAAFCGLPALAALGFYLLVTRRISDYGVDEATALPLIFPRPWSVVLGLALAIALAIGLLMLERRGRGARPLRSALLATAPLAHALHALVCLGTASPLLKLCGFGVDEDARRISSWVALGTAALFGVIWVALFAVQRRRYLTRRQIQTKIA